MRPCLASCLLLLLPCLLIAAEVHPLADRMSSDRYLQMQARAGLPGVLHPFAGGSGASDRFPLAEVPARVLGNFRMGADPSPLPTSLRAQAEPHLARNPLAPHHLVGTFQEGRYPDGGAWATGFAVSFDGGRTWTRGLAPGLSTGTKGPWQRSTDPVVAFDHLGRVYLNSLNFSRGGDVADAITVLASDDGGLTWSEPRVAARPPATGDFIDKNWIAGNIHADAPNPGRLVVTWTNFKANQQDHPIEYTWTDDRGLTWAAPRLLTPPAANVQGSFPLFRRDGTLRIFYYDFARNAAMVALFPDGGEGNPQIVEVLRYTRYADPEARSAGFLPIAAYDAPSDTFWITVQAWSGGTPRILVTRSTDGGLTWSPPATANDNIAAPSDPLAQRKGVFNPAIEASPGGSRVQVIYYDKRHDPDLRYGVDLYLAESLDGGLTWRENVRLTPQTTDMRAAPLTSSGYMLGDYQAIAASRGPAHPAVPIWIDARTGESDPFAARIADDPYLWADAETQGSSFRGVAWFGSLWDVGFPWCWHVDHAWLYTVSTTPDNVWLYDAELGWWWTREGVYPSLYQFTTATWLRYEPGSSNPRVFTELGGPQP